MSANDGRTGYSGVPEAAKKKMMSSNLLNMKVFEVFESPLT
jgi:hypothetical protein